MSFDPKRDFNKSLIHDWRIYKFPRKSFFSIFTCRWYASYCPDHVYSSVWLALCFLASTEVAFLHFHSATQLPLLVTALRLTTPLPKYISTWRWARVMFSRHQWKTTWSWSVRSTPLPAECASGSSLYSGNLNIPITTRDLGFSHIAPVFPPIPGATPLDLPTWSTQSPPALFTLSTNPTPKEHLPNRTLPRWTFSTLCILRTRDPDHWPWPQGSLDLLKLGHGPQGHSFGAIVIDSAHLHSNGWSLR